MKCSSIKNILPDGKDSDGVIKQAEINMKSILEYPAPELLLLIWRALQTCCTICRLRFTVSGCVLAPKSTTSYSHLSLLAFIFHWTAPNNILFGALTSTIRYTHPIHRILLVTRDHRNEFTNPFKTISLSV